MKAFHFAILMALTVTATPVTAQNSRAPQDLVQAIREGNGNKVTELLEGKPAGLINARADDGETALMAAIIGRNDDFTGYLLNKGADPNLPGKGGELPLIAATRLGSDDVIEWLLQSGAKVDGANRLGETALIVAVQTRQPQIVRRLLQMGADPDRADHAQGFSARDYAARDPRAVSILKTINELKPKR